MRVYLVNPSDVAFGLGVITPRWLYVLAAATPSSFGDPVPVDETLEPFDLTPVQPGDVVGIGIHTSNAVKGYEIGRQAREQGAYVIFGGIHATLFPEEAQELGAAHAVVKGDGDLIWGQVLSDCQSGSLQEIYDGGKIDSDQFLPARWDLMPEDGYMWASVQTVRGCPKHCSFCSVWRTDGQKPRQRTTDMIIQEIVQLRRMGFRFIALADDNFYPVTMEDLKLAKERNQTQRLAELQSLRDERFELMERMAKLPKDMNFFTQITMEAAEDPDFLDAMNRAKIRGALVGIESVTEEGLKAVYKEFNSSGKNLVQRLQTFRDHKVYVLGSFIFGLPTDREDTFDTTVDLAQEADIAFAQFVMLTPFPGTVDFQRWEKSFGDNPPRIADAPLTRYWLIPGHLRPKLFSPHPHMDNELILRRAQDVWDRFYSLSWIWKRSSCTPTLRSRLAFVLLSKLYRQMYANTGLATDSARHKKSKSWARWLAKPAQKLFRAAPMPHLEIPPN